MPGKKESDFQRSRPYNAKPAVWAQILKNAFNIPTNAVLSISQQPNTLSNTHQAQCSNDFWMPGKKESDFQRSRPYNAKPAVWAQILKNAFNIPTNAVLSICQQPNILSNTNLVQCIKSFQRAAEKASEFQCTPALKHHKSLPRHPTDMNVKFPDRILSPLQSQIIIEGSQITP
jgi:hypothetical protein